MGRMARGHPLPQLHEDSPLLSVRLGALHRAQRADLLVYPDEPAQLERASGLHPGRHPQRGSGVPQPRGEVARQPLHCRGTGLRIPRQRRRRFQPAAD